MILIIDNYDSFTYNLYQAVGVLLEKFEFEFKDKNKNLEIKIIRNDALTVEQIRALNPAGIILSPGPGEPSKAGVCLEVIQKLGKDTPILGVCLGHQAIGLAFGGTIQRATEQLHGKQTLIFHDRSQLFQQVSLPFKAGRYHSLIIDRLDFPSVLKIDAEDAKGYIMGLSHREYPIFGVQFHPESILTPEGKQILKNFLNICFKNNQPAVVKPSL